MRTKQGYKVACIDSSTSYIVTDLKRAIYFLTLMYQNNYGLETNGRSL